MPSITFDGWRRAGAVGWGESMFRRERRDHALLGRVDFLDEAGLMLLDEVRCEIELEQRDGERRPQVVDLLALLGEIHRFDRLVEQLLNGLDILGRNDLFHAPILPGFTASYNCALGDGSAHPRHEARQVSG